MTAKAALAKELLSGRVITIMSGFMELAITNTPREVSRMIEKDFGVEVSRTPRKKNGKYGRTVNYYEYRLNRTERNKEGIEKMKAYVKSQEK